MSTFELWRRRLTPGYVSREARRIGRKLVHRITQPHRRVARLPAQGEKRGHALVSFWIEPYLLPPDAEVPYSHTHYWESREVGRIWSELGFDVDAIHWTNLDFEPQVDYDVFVDVRLNLERLAPKLGPDCLKLQHIETGHYEFHNRAQMRRLAMLEERRGFRIRPQKLIEPNRAIENADFATTTGNEFTIGTYAHAGKEIRHVPISAPRLFPSPEAKDFEACRHRWLWFGSGGLVHKGLDLVLDAFREMPDHELVVCGPIQAERDFERAYAKELYGTPNIRTLGWVDIAGDTFREVVSSCAGLVYPSCSEGGGGSVITCLHAGLVPILTWETSVDFGDWGVRLADDSVDTIREAVRRTAAEPAERLRELATNAWRHARETHSREMFHRAYREAAETYLDRWSRTAR